MPATPANGHRQVSSRLGLKDKAKNPPSIPSRRTEVKSVIACSFKAPPQPLPLLAKEGLLRLPLPSNDYLLLSIYHPPFI